MDFGIALQWADFRHVGLSPTLIEVANRASELGFRSLWATDQMTARSDPAFSIEPLITTASLIHIVPDMQLGVAVLVLPQRNAVVVAKQAATLSLLSEGRLILGVGAGGVEHEFSLLDADFKSRGRRMDESIDVMRRLWQDAGAEFAGEFYNFKDVTMDPKPGADTIPLWIGGSSPPAIHRAARMGDGWLPALVDPPTLGKGVAQMQTLLQGRPMPTVATMEFVYPRAAGDEERPGPINIGGSVEEMIATLRRYEQAGLEHLVCSFVANDLTELFHQLQIFSAVMPHFSGQTDV